MRRPLVVGFLLFLTQSLSAQTRIVTGTVKDSLSGDAVTSGQVTVVGTIMGTTIKDDGTFTLAVPTRDVTLLIRSVGFKKKELVLAASTNGVQVAMDRDYFQLEAIVVTGQATGVERKNLANSVASVDAQQLVRASAATVEQSLMGKVASAQIQDLGGGPGGGVLVTLRGTTSLNNAYTPLYVVDGIIVSDAKVPRGINRLTQATGANDVSSDEEQPINRIGDLNPDDIASVEVLKGASASAIYGSRASNGVILVTTKRGRVGTPQFSVSQSVGTSRVFRKVGGRVFGSMQEAVDQFGPIASTYWTPTVFDHDEEVAGRMPLHYETALSVNGGTETTRYYASGLVRHEGGIISSTYADKQSLRLNLDQDIGSRVKLTLSAAAVHNGNDRGLTGNDNANVSYWAALTGTPSFFDLRAHCPDGSRQIQCDGGKYDVNPFSNSNPLATVANEKNPESVWRSISSGRLQVDVINSAQHSLQFSANGGVDVFNQKNEVFSPPDLQYESLKGFLGTYVLSFGRGMDGNISGNMVYKFTPSSRAFSATTSAGAQYENRSVLVSRTLSEGLIGGLGNITAGTHVVVDETRNLTKDFGFFAQEEVLLKERLLFTVGGRADQSGNNSDPTKLFFYPKAAVSYRFKPKPGLADELKLRAAVGESGNEPNYGFKFSELNNHNIVGTPGYSLANTIAAEDLHPERQREIEAGVDATMFGSRANLEFTVYDKRISDLLLTRTLAPVNGFSTQIFNGGVMRTRGLEVGLNLIPIQATHFQWNPRINFFMSRSKILNLPVPTFRQYDFGAQYGSLQIEEGKSPTQVIAWVPSVAGDPTSPQMDAVIGDYNPDYKISLANDFSIGRVRFYFLLDHYQGGWIHNYTELLYDFVGNTKDFLTPVTPGSPLAAYGTTNGAARIAAGTSNCSSCAWMQPMTSTKLREATVSLELPPGFLHRFWSGARSARLSLSGRNLLILTGYRGGDPEVLVQAATLFTQWRSDIWPYPPFRTFWFKVDVGF